MVSSMYLKYHEKEWTVNVKAEVDVDMEHISTCTWNVLFDIPTDYQYVKNITQPLQRYQKISDILSEMNTTFITLNEVTPVMFKFLQQQKWVQDNYLILGYQPFHEDEKIKISNIILSKIVPTNNKSRKITSMD